VIDGSKASRNKPQERKRGPNPRDANVTMLSEQKKGGLPKELHMFGRTHYALSLQGAITRDTTRRISLQTLLESLKDRPSWSDKRSVLKRDWMSL
jgi:hypothetical protein